MLLHIAGEAVRDIYYAQAKATDAYKDVRAILEGHFNPMKNIDYKIFMFGQLKQNEHESIDDFVVRLRKSIHQHA